MSHAARRRGRGRATAPPTEDTSNSPRRGGPRQGAAGAFDSPASRGSGSAPSRGRRPSNPPSAPSGPAQPAASDSTLQEPQSASRSQSVSASQGQSIQPTVVPRRDPARDPQNVPRYTDQLKNIDLSAEFFNIDQLYDKPTDFKRRPGFNTTGQAVRLSLNAVPVVDFPKKNVYQYDVVIGNGAENRAVQRKVWASKERESKTGQGMIYDGNKLAWSLTEHPEIRTMVDLDKEEGFPSRGDKNTYRLRITKTKRLDISIIDSFLQGRVQMGIPVAEAISFLDHLLREGPSLNPHLVSVKRSFFARSGQRQDLGGGIEVFRGVYQSMRLAEGQKMVVNIDVANCCFFKPGSLLAAMVTNMDMRDASQLARAFQSEQSNGSKRLSATAKTAQGRFKGTALKAIYDGNPNPNKEWKMFKINTNSANEEMLEWKDPVTKKPTGRMVSVTQYFKERYNCSLRFPQLPLIEMTKKSAKFPMELLHIKENQRYSTKLNELQTSNMIKFAVAPPDKRLAAINEGKSWLNWEKDAYLQNYGLHMGKDFIQTNARLLPPPGVKFGNRTEQPQTRGRWDLRGKTFLTANPQILEVWGIGIFENGRIRPDKAIIDKFVADFTRAYRGHGGQVANRPPYIAKLVPDAGNAVEYLHQGTGNTFKRRPQLLIFLVQDKQSQHYLRIKKSCDVRYGVVSQVMQLAQVQKGNPQYYSNVLMKVNAKLGGCTSQVVPHPSSGFKSFSVPTMIIGADVSHPSPGSQDASMAAITVSFDRHAGRYTSACQTNGHRVEVITENNWRNMLQPLVTEWVKSVGAGQLPQRLYYIRDGVSEGQFAHVMNQEVPHIKACLSAVANKQWTGNLTVIVASKRHHVRAFPAKGPASDQRGNPVPGCLIERDVTTPNEFDFYLYSHTALQGTSRPVHYTILYDDADHTPNAIQNMIYEHCYQYMRSTTSVSLHPAVYYAHLASNRAKAHVDMPSSRGPTGGPGFKVNQPPSSDTPETEVKPLMAMFNMNNIRTSMWYI
ncbi:hypothetical protein DV736_g5076, partial [Chaetothyriales sp. CBS 134916]